MSDKVFCIYILTNQNNTVLYTGVTNDLARRVAEHKEGQIEGFTKRYKCTKLVYYEVCGGAVHAITREKQLKGGSRKKKIRLIEKLNPMWKDLFSEIVG
ncbi:MAG TPA: GIY-YIG nuclease family protein [Bacteroidota bacterium]|nr:GIY-YIG nuclease family protein [Bacteroidota bacterium]